jgi:hypothetical protein
MRLQDLASCRRIAVSAYIRAALLILHAEVTNLLSHQVRVRAELGDIPTQACLTLCCEPCRVGRDMPVGLLLES